MSLPILSHIIKNVRDSVEQEINATRKVYVEPKIFTEEYEDNIDEYLKRSNKFDNFVNVTIITEDVTFIYRLKAVEEYKQLGIKPNMKS